MKHISLRAFLALAAFIAVFPSLPLRADSWTLWTYSSATGFDVTFGGNGSLIGGNIHLGPDSPLIDPNGFWTIYSGERGVYDPTTDTIEVMGGARLVDMITGDEGRFSAYHTEGTQGGNTLCGFGGDMEWRGYSTLSITVGDPGDPATWSWEGHYWGGDLSLATFSTLSLVTEEVPEECPTLLLASLAFIALAFATRSCLMHAKVI